MLGVVKFNAVVDGNSETGNPPVPTLDHLSNTIDRTWFSKARMQDVIRKSGYWYTNKSMLFCML